MLENHKPVAAPPIKPAGPSAGILGYMLGQ
jgi:hypothetical protein